MSAAMSAADYVASQAKRKLAKEHQRLDDWLEREYGDVLEREYVFHVPEPGEKKRRWRFDYVLWPESHKVAIEFEGTVSNAAHTSVTNVLNDSMKFNTAMLQGWLIIRCNTPNLRDGSAYKAIEKAIDIRMRRAA